MGRSRHAKVLLAGALTFLGLLICLAAGNDRADAGLRADAHRTKTKVQIFENGFSLTEYHSYTHPARFQFSEVDTIYHFSHLRWRGWGGRRAVARGHAAQCGGQNLNGGGMICYRSRVKLVADQWRPVCDSLAYYQRLRVYGIPGFGKKPMELPIVPSECA